MKVKPKLGVAFFIAKWFEDVVLGSDSSSSQFNKFVTEDTQKITNELSKDFEVIVCPFVTSIEKAQNACKILLAKDIDCLLLIFLVWSEDEYLLYFKDIITIRPTILWTYTPYFKAPQKSDLMTLFKNSGIVGTFEAFGVLKKMGAKIFLVTGDYSNKATYEEIKKIGNAAKVLKALKNTKLGILPYRNDQMIVTYVDEFRLYCQIGPRVEFISILQLKKAIDVISDDEIKKYVKDIKANFKIDKRISDENLYYSARAALGFQKIIFDRELDGIALSDLNNELHEVIGLRPCLYPEKLAKSGKVVGNEGDLGCTTGMLILQMLTDNPVIFTEIFNIDFEENIINAGHAGPANFLTADLKTGISITPDYELMDAKTNIGGVWMEFIGKPGKVTILNFICTNDSFQATILGGQSLGGKLRFDGYPHYSIRIDTPISDFLMSNAASGVSHHWAVAIGDVRQELSYLADMLNIKKVLL